MDFVKESLEETVLARINLSEFRIEGILVAVSKDYIQSLGFQSISPKHVLIKAVLAWAMADEVGKAALLVCAMSGNKHARLLKKGRVDAAKFLSPLVVDTAAPTDLTLGRFAVSLACVFRMNIEGWGSMNSGHAAFSEAVYTKYFYNFLTVQVRSWVTYNPSKELTLEIIQKSANIMNQQRSSCVLFLSNEAPFSSPMTPEAFTALYKLGDSDAPRANPAPPCCTSDEVQSAIRALTEDDIKHLKVRSYSERTIKFSDSLDSTSSSSSGIATRVERNLYLSDRDMRFKALKGGWFDSKGFYVSSDGHLVVDEDEAPLSVEELINQGLIVKVLKT